MILDEWTHPYVISLAVVTSEYWLRWKQRALCQRREYFQKSVQTDWKIESERTCRPGSCDLTIIGKYPTRLFSQVNDIYEVHGKSSCIAMALSDVVEILTNYNSVPKLRQVLPTEKPRGNPTVIPKVS